MLFNRTSGLSMSGAVPRAVQGSLLPSELQEKSLSSDGTGEGTEAVSLRSVFAFAHN